MGKPPPRFRRWVFTLNNYTDAEIELLKAAETSYLLYGKEVGDEGTPHLQGYLQLKTPISFSALKQRLGTPRIHLESAKGSPMSNDIYCKKQDDWFEQGTCKGLNPGKRTDLLSIRDRIKAGSSVRRLIEDGEVSSYQGLRLAERLYDYVSPKRSQKTRVFYLWGGTGLGKSYIARKVLPDAYWCMKSNKWWPGYDGHKHVIMDDVRGSFCSFSTMLRLLDEYPMTVEYKGGTRQLLAEVIIMTSCKPPNELYDVNEDQQQLVRRIEEVIFLPDDITKCQVEDVVLKLSARIGSSQQSAQSNGSSETDPRKSTSV